MGSKRTATGKVIRPKIAVGGIDQDAIGWGTSTSSNSVSKKQRRAALREKEAPFIAFDPEKRLRKQGRVGSSSFKSKKKFKRR